MKKLALLLLCWTATLCVARAQFIFPPDLQCVVKDIASGSVTLYWTNIPNNCGPFVDYTIYAANSPAGPYNPLATVVTQSQNSFIHAGALPGTWYYYMVANFNCPGAAALSSDTINTLNPDTVRITNVTVNPNNTVDINWQPSPSKQTYGYVVYYFLPNGNAQIIDTVFGYNNTTYTDALGDPSAASQVYTIAAFDSCWQYSSYNETPHRTILATASTASCQNDVNVNWSSYFNWPQGVKEYQVWASNNNAPFTLAGVTDTFSKSFNYSNFMDGDSVCVYVRAVAAHDTTVVSTSNVVCLRALVVKTPSFNFITNATVDLNDHITLTWMIDSTAELIYQQIERSANNTQYDVVNQLAVQNPPLPTFNTYIDSGNIFPDKNAYYYTVTLLDSCQALYESPYVRTINLQGELFDYYVSSLTWNDFELQHATVLRYRIYRNVGVGYQLIKTVPFGVKEMVDSLQQFVNEQGIFCYRVEAEYALDLPNGYRDTLSSFSNEMCIIHRPIIYIPNAFSPYGVNNVFKPTIIYGNPKGYTMTIFNRWGGKVFETNDPATGWDGTDRGTPADMGGYAYLIRFTAEDGVRVERKGMVLLVK